MNAKDRTDSNSPPAPSVRRRFLQHLEDWWVRQTKIAVATYFFGIIMWILGWSFYATNLAALKLHGHPSQSGERFFCEGLPWVTLVFFIVWTFLCFRWRKVRRADKHVHPGTFVFSVLVTAWLSLFMAISPCAAAAPTQTNTVPQLSQMAQITSTPATNNPKPNTVLCEALLFICYLIAAAAAIYLVWLHYCDLFGWCGHTGNEPPQSPGTNQTQIVRSPLTDSPDTIWPINPNVGLPAVSFAVQDNVVVSNSAGLAIGTFPSFFRTNNAPVGLGGLITSAQPGITIPPSVSVWDETNFYADSNLDPIYPYVALFNYTVLTSTNLIDWREYCTVIGWANSNPQMPLQCCIIYTNGTPMTTNWDQSYLDSSGQVTNIVVYGNLPFIDSTNLPQFRPQDGPPSPGGGGSGTNDVPFNSSGQFYRLTCNTNAIETSWPW